MYEPCVLLSKKRYAGYKYEREDSEPVIESKGIETVRRDGVEALTKTFEKVLKMLFTSRDLSQVKRYLYRQWSKIESGHVSVPDFTFSKPVRLGMYQSRPPAAIVAEK